MCIEKIKINSKKYKWSQTENKKVIATKITQQFLFNFVVYLPTANFNIKGNLRNNTAGTAIQSATPPTAAFDFTIIQTSLKSPVKND